MRYSSRGRVSTRFPSTNEIIYAIGIASTVDPGVKYESGGGERRGSARECKVWRAYERVRRRERGRGGGKGRGKEGPGRRFSPLRVEARSRARGYGKKVNAPQPRTHSRPTQRASLCERQEMRGQTSGERSVPGAHRPFAATHTARSLLSRSMQRAHVCNPVSTSRVLSTLPIGRTSNHKFQRPPQRSPAPILYSLLSLRSSKPFDLGLSRTFVPCFSPFFSADTNNNGSRRVRAKVLRNGERSTRILLFFFFNDRRGGSIGEFSREKVERDGTMGGDGNPRLRPFSSGERERRGEGEGERVARSTPIGRRRHPSPISEDQRFLNPVARVCVAS